MKTETLPVRVIFRPIRFVLAGIVLLLLWILTDIYIPIQNNIRNFEATEVARLDTEMWRSYYDRKPVVLFNQLAELMRKQFHAPFFRSYLMAYQAAKAAFVFKDGENRSDYEKALPYLVDFYGNIELMSNESFNVTAAARHELEWWIIHRQRANNQPGDLETALAQTAESIYNQPASQFMAHARLRAQAMHIRDIKAVNGGVTESDWQEISRLLMQSWDSFEKVVKR
ncbi:hypothetical protein GXP67_28990 [Rhodocytophaga rosea]|uniref:Uncharacterized protein n=1 Tax=Rhodocytophaga rosea TaxID=2704465 RepID=A0A6C0GRA4_9BACT|nr:hypothetical protein [Rhodocytophaga rosea]QHT70404.1 hypothetical protein GXP67_28990 [Rhodocytophaga rosea]